ncbi:MAG TPA: hypothetical protein DDY13_09945 [Cytophagales bacterium]|nr:hypothetical protein [Cytophagales bacterium]
MLKKTRIGLIILILLVPQVMPSCKVFSSDTVIVHKPRKHNRPYNHKNDRGKKRLKKVRMKK